MGSGMLFTSWKQPSSHEGHAVNVPAVNTTVQSSYIHLCIWTSQKSCKLLFPLIALELIGLQDHISSDTFTILIKLHVHSSCWSLRAPNVSDICKLRGAAYISKYSLKGIECLKNDYNHLDSQRQNFYFPTWWQTLMSQEHMVIPLQEGCRS